MKILFTAFLIFISLLSGCATQVNNHYVEPSFDVEKLEGTTITIGGFVTNLGPNTVEIYPKIDIAVNAMNPARKDIQILSSHLLQSQLGKVKYEKLVQDSVSQFGGSQQLPTLNLNQQDGYLLFSRVLSDETYHEESEMTHETKNGDIQVVTYSTERIITIQSDIYDFKNKNLVWSGEIATARARENEGETANGSLLQNLVVDLINDLFVDLYPEPYSFDEMISAAFKDLVFALPHKTCSELGLIGCLKQKAWQSVY